MSTSSKQKSKYNTQQTLWCLPYDTDTVFKPFLKVPFSAYLNNIISNEYFPQYQSVMAKEISDRNLWNEKCWRIIQFFQFLNNNFEIDKWDNHISFIEDNTLRSTMGFFRLWIDTERLYLMNFLKLDSNQFQEDRIYMSTYRILIFFNSLFSEYMFKDFDINFLNNFIKNCTSMLQKTQVVSTNDTGEIISYTITLLANIKKREKFLIDPKLLHTLKKSAAIKVSKQSQLIGEVENRLMNSVGFKKKIDEQLRLKMICKPGFIQQYTNGIRTLYDPIQKIQEQQGQQFFGTPQQKSRRRQQFISEKVQKYKKEVKEPVPTNIVIYEELQKNGRNPYQIQNFLIYGEAVKINMENKTKYLKTKQVQVVSVEDHDRSKLYYDEQFLKEMENADKHLGKVTIKDLNIGGSKGSKKPNNLNGNHDQNTKVFNLKWHQDPSSARRKTQHEDNEYGKNYDNNLLFKSPLQDQMLQSSKNSLDKLRQDIGTKTYTIAVFQQQASEIHPPNHSSSFGVDQFIKKTPQILDIRNFKLLNHNKFDFMRKVVGYMTAQKKIKNILAEKNVPDQLPRYYSDVKQDSYNPILQTEKVKYAMGKLDHRPQIYL